jgi:hypothetical protein
MGPHAADVDDGPASAGPRLRAMPVSAIWKVPTAPWHPPPPPHEMTAPRQSPRGDRSRRRSPPRCLPRLSRARFVFSRGAQNAHSVTYPWGAGSLRTRPSSCWLRSWHRRTVCPYRLRSSGRVRGAVKKSRSFLGRHVRCCASRAAPLPSSLEAQQPNQGHYAAPPSIFLSTRNLFLFKVMASDLLRE